MGVVLLKASDSCEPGQRTAQFISVQHSKICYLNRQLPVGMRLVLEDQTVAGTVHRLQTLYLLRTFAILTCIRVLQKIQVVLIILVVPRGLPEIDVEEVWRHHFLVASLQVLVAHEFDKLVIYLGAMRQEESASRRKWTEEEELLILSDQSVITTLCFFLQFQILRKLALLRK